MMSSRLKKKKKKKKKKKACKHKEVKAYNKIIVMSIGHAKDLSIHDHKPQEPYEKTQSAYPHFLALLS